LVLLFQRQKYSSLLVVEAVVVMLMVMVDLVVVVLVEQLFIQEDHFLPQLLIQSLLELVVLVLARTTIAHLME
jgi:hypothetical protein